MVTGGEMRSGSSRRCWPSRHGQGEAAVGDSLYVVGGALQPGDGGVTDQLLMFTLPGRS